MGTYDQDRYRSLIARAAFDCSFYKGTIQDQSAAQRAMSFVGTHRWRRLGGFVGVVATRGQNIVSGVVAEVVDNTLPFFVEVVFSYDTTQVLPGQWLVQSSGGGWDLYPDMGNCRFYLRLYTAAGAIARTAVTPVGSLQFAKATHLMMGFSAAGATGLSWINGIPVTTAMAGAGIPARIAGPVVFGVQGHWQETLTMALARVWQGAPSHEDVSALYGAAKVLTGGEV